MVSCSVSQCRGPALIIKFFFSLLVYYSGGGVHRGDHSTFCHAGDLTGTSMADVRRPRSQVQRAIPETGRRSRDGDDASVASESRSVS